MVQFQKLVDATLRSAWWRVLHLWRPMVLWTLLAWALMSVVLVPLSSAALRHMFFRGEGVIMGNEALLAWMLTPAGLVYVIGVGVLSTIGAVFRFSGLYWMVTDDMAGKAVSVRRTLLDLLPDFPALLRLCLATTAGALLLAAPLALGLAAVYRRWLGQYDINYYLAVQPAEWSSALLAAGIWTTVWMVGAGYVFLHSLPALPAYLTGIRPIRVALQRSWRLVRGGALRMLRVVFVIVVVWLGVRAVVQAIVFFAASHLAGTVAATVRSVTPLLAVGAAFSVTTILLDAVLSFLGFSIVATALTKFYHEESGLKTAIHPAPSRERTILRRWMAPRRALPLMLAAVVLSTLLGGLIIDMPAEEPSVTVTAHRAGAHLATENTLAALEQSIEAGADYVEIDVQTTRDSVVVVLHDADLMRLAADPRVISRTDYADLRDILLGRGAEGDESERRLATLDTFLTRAKGRIGVNIELKYYGWDPHLVGRVLELVRQHEMTSPQDVVMMSLSLEAVRQVRRLAPELHTGYVAAVTAGDVTRLGVEFLAVPRQLATRRFIRNARRRDVAVHVWTLNRTDAVLEMIERGVDGIITDNPRLVRRLIDELAALSLPERLLLSFRPLLIDDDEV